MSHFVTLQPCFDRGERVRAYEVAHRPVGAASGGIGGGGAGGGGAASGVGPLLDALLAIGVGEVTGGQPALIPVAREQLGEPELRGLPPGAGMLVVDATDDPWAPWTAEVLRALGQAGVPTAARMPLRGEASAAVLAQARLVVLDVGTATPAAARARLGAARATGLPVLARQAAPGTTAAGWAEAGATLVQWGTLSVAPRRGGGGRGPSANDANALRLLGALRDPRVGDRDLEDGFKRDLALSYDLLRLVNSAAVAGREIHSIGHAIRLLGREVIHRRLATVVLRSLGDGGVRGEVAARALLRGRFCESMAEVAGMPKAGGPLFTVGFLSLLPELLGIPTGELGRHVPLAADVRDAIERRAGFYGAILSVAEAWEGEDWDLVRAGCAEAGLDAAALAARYLKAVAWGRAQLGLGRQAAA